MTDPKRESKVVLVTGASRGIGRSVAHAFARGGYLVLVNFRSGAEAAEETVSLCSDSDGQAKAMQFDVADPEQVDAAFRTIKDEFGGLDVLVNNAGISRDGLLARFKNEDWDATIGTNLSGAFYASRAAAKLMIRAKSGSIINMSSVVGEMGNAGQAAYVSAKAGLLGLTKALARELASRNITVNAITPGFIETDMTAALDDKVRQGHLDSIPLSRYGQPDEIAALAVFLASEQARYITGQVVGVNGGLYM